MKRQCAWCGRVFEPADTGEGNESISHGICLECAEELRSEARELGSSGLVLGDCSDLINEDYYK